MDFLRSILTFPLRLPVVVLRLILAAVVLWVGAVVLILFVVSPGPECAELSGMSSVSEVIKQAADRLAASEFWNNPSPDALATIARTAGDVAEWLFRAGDKLWRFLIGSARLGCEAWGLFR